MANRGTALLVTPTLDEVKLAAAKIGLPPREAERFFYFYDSKDWKVGKVRMTKWLSALAGWKLRWEEQQKQNDPPNTDDWRQSL